MTRIEYVLRVLQDMRAFVHRLERDGRLQQSMRAADQQVDSAGDPASSQNQCDGATRSAAERSGLDSDAPEGCQSV